MTPVRQRTLEDMQVCYISRHTQQTYIEQVSRFARHFGQSPERLGTEEIRAYQVFQPALFTLIPTAASHTSCASDDCKAG